MASQASSSMSSHFPVPVSGLQMAVIFSREYLGIKASSCQFLTVFFPAESHPAGLTLSPCECRVM